MSWGPMGCGDETTVIIAEESREKAKKSLQVTALKN